VAVTGHVRGLWFSEDCASPLAWTMLHLCYSTAASVAYSMWCFNGLDYAFAYACFYCTSVGHCTWYLVPCNELSLAGDAIGQYWTPELLYALVSGDILLNH
jgi:hypothetical protein